MQRFSFTQTQQNCTTENDIGTLEETHLIIELYLKYNIYSKLWSSPSAWYLDSVSLNSTKETQLELTLSPHTIYNFVNWYEIYLSGFVITIWLETSIWTFCNVWFWSLIKIGFYLNFVVQKSGTPGEKDRKYMIKLCAIVELDLELFLC